MCTVKGIRWVHSYRKVEALVGKILFVPDRQTEVKDHPLRNLPQQIEENKVVVIDPETDKPYPVGAYFPHYGAAIVEGGNIEFNIETSEEGRVTTTLTCRVNDLYWKKVQILCAHLNPLTLCEKEMLAALLHCPRIDILPATRVGRAPLQSVFQYQECGAYHLEGGGALQVGVLDVPISPKSNELVEKKVKFSLEGRGDVKDFYTLLSYFGLESILTPFTGEDTKRRHLGFIFEYFFPMEAKKLRQYADFYRASPDQLRERMTALVPSMQENFSKYEAQVSERKILGNYTVPSIPVVPELKKRGLGGIARRIEIGERTATVIAPDALCRIASVVNQGILSYDITHTETGNFTSAWKEINDRIIANVVWQEDIVDEARIKYRDKSTTYAQLIFSTDLLQRAVAVFNPNGYNEASYYANRGLSDVIKDDLSEGNIGIMCEKAIAKEEIKAILVQTPELQSQLMDAFRTKDMVYSDTEGKERLKSNNLFLTDFVLTAKSLSQAIFKNC